METTIHANNTISGQAGNIMRNKNIDIVRSIALLWVLFYHIWILTGAEYIPHPVPDAFLSLGGEIGVTIFFILSGYGIFHSLMRMDDAGRLRFFPFMKKRLIRILPEYYLSIIVLLLFSAQAAFLSKAGILQVVLHLVFLHNLDPSAASSVNGALWTMALIVQFYLVSIPMYLLLKKTKYLFPVIFVAFSVGFKVICFHYMGRSDDFWVSRQILPAVIDNFALGMFTAWLIQRKACERTNTRWFNLIMIALSIVMLYAVCRFGMEEGIHTDTFSGYIWHTLVALCACLGIFFFARKELTGNHILKRGMLWISENEYGVYIVHLVLIENLLEYSTIMQEVSAHPFAKYVLFTVLSLFAGWVLNRCADGIRIRLNRPRVANTPG